MSNLATKVKLYLEANGKSASEIGSSIFDANAQIHNDGDGDYLKVWTVPGLARPTEEQLDALDSQGDTTEANEQVDKTRRRAYGDWKNQLDEIYHDIDSGKLGEDAKTGTWYLAVKKVKDDNPKS